MIRIFLTRKRLIMSLSLVIVVTGIFRVSQCAYGDRTGRLWNILVCAHLVNVNLIEISKCIMLPPPSEGCPNANYNCLTSIWDSYEQIPRLAPVNPDPYLNLNLNLNSWMLTSLY